MTITMSNRERDGDDVPATKPAGVGAGGSTEVDEGGEPACWAHLVCPECGAITSEGHRPGCVIAGDAARKG